MLGTQSTITFIQPKKKTLKNLENMPELNFKQKLIECINVELLALEKLINKMQGTQPIWKPKVKFNLN